jgi:hypothetical protein
MFAAPRYVILLGLVLVAQNAVWMTIRLVQHPAISGVVVNMVFMAIGFVALVVGLSLERRRLRRLAAGSRPSGRS